MNKKLKQESFEFFWKEYPRKMAKKNALRMWMKIELTEELFLKIMHALSYHKRSKQWTEAGGQYIPYPATWINQERWNDEIKVTINVPSGDSKYKGL